MALASSCTVSNLNNEVFGFYNGSTQYFNQREYYQPTVAADSVVAATREIAEPSFHLEGRHALWLSRPGSPFLRGCRLKEISAVI